MFDFLKSKKSKQELRNLAAMFAILDGLENHGVLYWQRKDQNLLIEQYMAKLKLNEGAEGFRHFLEQIATWQSDRLIKEAYARHTYNVETNAVRDAMKKHRHLTAADVLRIKSYAREHMEPIPLEKLDCVKEFGIYIIRAKAPSQEDATEAAGQLLAVGHYTIHDLTDSSKNELEMAMYEDIKNNL